MCNGKAKVQLEEVIDVHVVIVVCYYLIFRPVYPHDEGEEEVVQETEGELSQVDDEIQEDMIEESDEEEGTFLDLTNAMDHDMGGTSNEVSLIRHK